MKSIIICEGYTDCVLLQYFLRKVYGWQDSGRDKVLENTFKSMRVLKKAGDTVRIGGCGGCSEIIPKLNFVLDMNNISAEQEAEFNRIVIITDRDEIGTEQDFISKIKDTLADNHVTAIEEIKNNEWSLCTYCNGRGKNLQMRLLLLVIPFSGTGAMETFLLNAIAGDNSYDANIIQQCNSFVDHIDPQKKYLTQRRYITKAKFNVYFSVRVAEGQFVERQNVLQNVKWEDYGNIQMGFKKLYDLSVNL